MDRKGGLGWCAREAQTPQFGSVVCLLVLITAFVTASASAETWWALNNSANHTGCTANEICAGTIAPDQGGTYWQGGHVYGWSLSVSDVDCHQPCDSIQSYMDCSENLFRADWTLWKLVGNQWIALATKSGPADGVTLDTSNHTAGHFYWQAKNIDDTPLDGPKGDDTPVTDRVSDCFTVVYHHPVGWHRADFPVSGEPYLIDGFLVAFRYEYDVSCGNNEHATYMDGHVDMREYVLYPGEDDPFEWPTNTVEGPWLGSTSDNPTTASMALDPSTLYQFDQQHPGQLINSEYIAEGAAFVASQTFQWKYSDEPATQWRPLGYAGIPRTVYEDQDTWHYELQKHGYTIDFEF